MAPPAQHTAWRVACSRGSAGQAAELYLPGASCVGLGGHCWRLWLVCREHNCLVYEPKAGAVDPASRLAEGRATHSRWPHLTLRHGFSPARRAGRQQLFKNENTCRALLESREQDRQAS